MAIFDLTYNPPTGVEVVGMWPLGGRTTTTGGTSVNGMWYSDNQIDINATATFFGNSPSSGGFPSSPSGNYTLTYTVIRSSVDANQLQSGLSGTVTGPITSVVHQFSSQFTCFRVSTIAAIRAAFGTGREIYDEGFSFNQGLWVMTRPGTAMPARITFEMSDIAATGGGVLPITPPPPPTTTYQNVATWNAAGYPGGSTTTVFAYANASLGLHYSCNVATSGTAPLTQPPAGTYRIRVSGGGSSAAQTGLIGTISNFTAQDGATNQCTIRIGTSSQWGTAFAGVPSSGVVWHLERQMTSSGGNTESTGATWNAGSGSANQTAIYQANGVLAVNSNAVTGFYNGNVPAGSLWRIRRAGQTATSPFRTLTNVQTGSNFFVLRVGTNADMTALFGTSQIQFGAAWILERQSSVPANPGQRGTTVGRALCHRGGVLSWELRNAIPTNFDVLTYNNTTQAMGFRTAQ